MDCEIKPELHGINNTISLQRVIDYNYSNKSYYNELESLFKITENTNEKILQQRNTQSENTVIDWGHHIIRNSVFKLRLLMNIYNNEKFDDVHDQFKEIMRKLGKREIARLHYNEYYKQVDDVVNNYRKKKELQCDIDKLNIQILREVDNNRLEVLEEELNDLQYKMKILEKNDSVFPLLVFNSFKESRYYEYCDAIECIVNSVKNKIVNAIKKHQMPTVMCPLEMVILHHMMLLLDHGRKSEVTIMDIYNIVYCYDDCFYQISKEEKEKHLQYECSCDKLFNKNRLAELQSFAMCDSIVRHYSILQCVDKLYEKYRQMPLVNQTELKYNIDKGLQLDVTSKQLPQCFYRQFIIASNAKDIIIIDCVPQFNELNANEIYTKMLYVGYVCNNMKNYENLRTHCILFALNHENPLSFDMHDKIIENKVYLRKSCFDAIRDNILQYTSLAWMYYNFHKNNAIKEKIKNSLVHTLRQCAVEKKTKIGTEYEPLYNFPKWLVGFFIDTNYKIANIDNKFKEILTNEEMFTKGLTEYIDRLIQKEIQTDDDYY